MSSNNQSKNPTHEVFIVENSGQPLKTFWHKIGVGWQNEKGVITTKRFAASLSGEEIILPVGYKK